MYTSGIARAMSNKTVVRDMGMNEDCSLEWSLLPMQWYQKVGNGNRGDQ